MRTCKNFRFVLAAAAACALLADARAAIWFVAPSGRDTAAGSDWTTAKSTIQAAIDAAALGDTVLVSNGVYAAGGRVLGYGWITNRIEIAKAITVRSVNGPKVTIISGVGSIGPDAVRCAYVGNNAVLSGFTLTNGATAVNVPQPRDCHGGGAYAETTGVLSNCVISGNRARFDGGGVFGGTLFNCSLSGNSAFFGGGAYAATLVHCAITGNSATYGGGTAWHCTLTNCTLAGNTARFGGGSQKDDLLDGCTIAGNVASEGGGGAQGGKLSRSVIAGNIASRDGGGTDGSDLEFCLVADNQSGNRGGGSHMGKLTGCTLTGNSSIGGGASAYGTLDNCRLVRNSAIVFGGGAFYGTQNDCLIFANMAKALYGGGVIGGTQNNCTIVGNVSSNLGGGAVDATLHNCIVYFNEAPAFPNATSNVMNFCCTTPLPDSGIGNISTDPLFADVPSGDFHLQPESRCIDAGTNAHARTRTDIDGLPRIVNGTVDLGAFEFQRTPPASVTTPKP